MNLRAFIANENWISAKTYAKTAPHEYLIRQKVHGSQEDFFEFARIIREYGFPAQFFKRPNMYFYIDGYFYWTMDEKVEDTTLINRCRKEDYNLAFYPIKKEST